MSHLPLLAVSILFYLAIMEIPKVSGKTAKSPFQLSDQYEMR